MKKREYFTIPNLMGYFRTLLIPVFLYLYYHAETMKEYVTAFGVLVLSFLTDLFDGKIARKFNMVTDFGKMLDPIADKLTQGAMAIAISFRNPFMIFFVVLFACKEIYMGVMGLYILKKYGKMNMAQMFGKICTTVLDVGVLVLLFFANMTLSMENVIIGLMTGMLIFTWVRYIVYHVNEIKELQNA